MENRPVSKVMRRESGLIHFFWNRDFRHSRSFRFGDDPTGTQNSGLLCCQGLSIAWEIRAVSFVMVVGLVVAIVALIAVPSMVRFGASIPSQTLAVIRATLLWIAGVFSGLMTLMILAAAWGMDTRLPWGLGIYMYLIPALSLPAFFS